MKRIVKRFFATCLFLAAVCLAGCGQADKEETTYPGDDGATASDASSEDRVVYELESSGGISITVDAEVSGAEKLSDMYCYDAEPITFDEAYLEEYVESAFDEGTAEYVKPYAVCDETELKIRLNELKDTRAGADASDEILQNGIVNDMASVQEYMDSSGEAETKNVGQSKGKIYTSVDRAEIETSYARVDGFIGGVPYVYQAVDVKEVNLRSFSYNRYDYLGVSVSVREKLAEEEAQGLDEDEAHAQADAFLKTIGYGDFSVCQTNLATYSYGSSETEIDAYVFSYSRNVNGIAVATTPGATALEFSIEQGSAADQEDIEVLVDANGVAKVSIRLAVYDVDMDGTKVKSHLSPEQADAAAQEYLSSYTDTQGFSEITIDSVRLAYVYIKYQDGSAGLIPAWSYYGEKGDTRRIFLFGVSAIDGQIIEGEYTSVEDVHFYIN